LDIIEELRVMSPTSKVGGEKKAVQSLGLVFSPYPEKNLQLLERKAVG
jgi:hypothetical protein